MKDNRSKTFLLCILSYLVVGLMVIGVNTTMNLIVIEYGWTDAQGGLLITMASLGALVISFFANTVMAKIGRRRAMILFCSLVPIACTLYAVTPIPSALYPISFAVGLAWGGINCASNTIVTEIYDGSPAKLNFLCAFYAVGAVLCPLMVGFCSKAGLSWRVPMAVVAAVGLVVAVLSFVIRIPDKISRADSEPKKIKTGYKFYKEICFYMCLLMFFFYVGVEGAVCSWMSPYLGRVNSFFSKVPSETMMSLMWIMLLAGRLFIAAVGDKIDRRWLITVLAVGFLVGLLGVIFLGGNTVLAAISVVFMGLSMSAMYGSCLSNAAEYVERSPIASGILYGMGNLGSALIPLFAGMISDHSSLKNGMISLCIMLCVMIAACIVNMVVHKRREAAA